MSKLIYVADDEKNIRELITSFLLDEGFEVVAFDNGDDLLSAFSKRPADLVILDIMMPGTDGFSVCSALRKKNDVPIILLTARDSDADFITGFTMGCDDYFTKPFSPIKLTMRVKAMFKRMAINQKTPSEVKLFCADVSLFPEAKEAFCGDKELKFTNTEYALLAYLMEHKDRAISRDELLSEIWGYENEVETRVTDDVVRRVRKKLASVGSTLVIETVWGFGFKLEPNS